MGHVARLLLTSTAIALLGRRETAPPGISPFSALRRSSKIRQAFLKLGALLVPHWDEAAKMHRMLSAPRSGLQHAAGKEANAIAGG